MNDVRTKKMRTYNFISRSVHHVPPLARVDYGLMRD